ncbi:MAG: carbon-nitrogen hydrolase [Polyangiales bacterium]
MTLLRIGVVQTSMSNDRDSNIQKIEDGIREAANAGAQLVVTPELFESLYFPQQINERGFSLAHPVENHPWIPRMQALAKELGVVLPISFYEFDPSVHGDKPAGFFNSLIMIDADGSALGVYRKTHIPSGPGYEEKTYFEPGNTGFRTWQTRYGRVGTGICWDQWFPESARAMALQGADVIVYPTAIGTEPPEPHLDSRDPWRRVMIGHAVANATPIVASNRYGVEDEITFYGSSFVADHRGDLLVDMPRDQRGVKVIEIDLDELARYRKNWGFFTDRQPHQYTNLCKTRQ